MGFTAGGIWTPEEGDKGKPHIYLATMAQSIEDGIGARLTPLETDTGWVDISSSLTSGFTGTMVYRRRVDTYEVRGNVGGSFPTGNTAFAIIPPEVRTDQAINVRGAGYFPGGFTCVPYHSRDGAVGISQQTGATRTSMQFTMMYFK